MTMAEPAPQRTEETAPTPTPKRRAKVIGHDEIPIDNIHPNPLNPRPIFHFGRENPDLVALGESIKTDGLHNPVKVYEIPDSPGNFRLVQGHRRREAAELFGVTILDCIIVEAPRSEREELEMLGSEDAHKREWPQLFRLHHAWKLAQKCGLESPANAEIAAKTGLNMRQLRVAEKVFRLEDAILGMVKEYEQLRYEQLLAMGTTRRQGRLARLANTNTLEFPVEKAALVWDLFCALSTHYPMAVRDYQPVELQRALAQLMSSTTLEDGENFLTQVRTTGANPKPGVLAKIHDMLEAPERKGAVKVFLRGTGGTHISRFAKTVKRIQALDSDCVSLARNVKNIGADPDVLAQGNIALLSLLRHADELQRQVNQAMVAAMKETR